MKLKTFCVKIKRTWGKFIKTKLSIFCSIILEFIKKLLIFLKDNFNILFSWIVFVTVTLVFKNKIAVFFAENSIIKHDDVKDKYFDLGFFIITLIIVIRYLWFGVKNYRLSQKHNYIIFFIALIYFSLRINENDSLYFSYLNIKYDLYYSDIILLIALLSILLLFRNMFFQNWKCYDNLMFKFNNFTNVDKGDSSSFLIEDVPLDGTSINDNEKVIDEVVKAVRNLKPSNSFIIGINSIWGIGKTSFLKRLEYKLQYEEVKTECKPIIFWFNAWQHQDEKSIINNFFNQLKKELSEFSGDSKNSIDNYLKEMFALVDNKYLSFFKSITENVFSEGDTIKDSYDEINNIIEQINRKIIVFVDDIDRLNKAEILETLRILRNIADFKNVIFICGLDREYVVKQSQIDNQYLDKIFNLEINLTTQNQKGVVNYLSELITNSKGYNNNEEKEILIRSINKIFYDTDEESNLDIGLFFDIPQEKNKNAGLDDEKELSIISLMPSFFFESRRDVKKFYNELYINIKTLENISDIEIEQYILLKLLLFKYKWMHKNFAAKRIHSWLGSDNVFKFEEANLKKLIINQEIEIQDEHIIFSTLVNLFPKDGVSNNSQKINQKRYFPIYFCNNVFNECLSYTQLINSIKNNKVEQLIIEIINRTEIENKNLIINDIKLYLFRRENISNIEEFEQVISLIKNKHLGLVTEVQIVNLLYLGETAFEIEYGELLDTIFTNFNDAFGLFLFELTSYYSKYPSDVSRNKRNNLENSISEDKIEGFKILNKKTLKDIILRIFHLEIEKENSSTESILSYSNLFYEYYFTDFDFGLFYKEFKPIIKKYITKNFGNIFLKNTAEETLLRMNVDLLANLFEDDAERKLLLKDAKKKSSERIKDISLNTNKSEMSYHSVAMDNFIKYVETIKSSMKSQELAKYNDFLLWLYTYQDILYYRRPIKKHYDEYLAKQGKNISLINPQQTSS